MKMDQLPQEIFDKIVAASRSALALSLVSRGVRLLVRRVNFDDALLDAYRNGAEIDSTQKYHEWTIELYGEFPSDENNPLIEAVRVRNLDMVAYMCEHIDTRSVAPLIAAVKYSGPNIGYDDIFCNYSCDDSSCDDSSCDGCDYMFSNSMDRTMLSYIKYLCDKYPSHIDEPDDEKLLKAVAAKGYYETFYYLHNNGALCTIKVCHAAIRAGALDIVEYIRDYEIPIGCNCTEFILETAAIYGHSHIIAAFLNENDPIYYPPQILKNAVKHDQPNVLQYLISLPRFTSWHFMGKYYPWDQAAQYGSRNVLSWLYEQMQSNSRHRLIADIPPWSRKTTILASVHKGLVQWLVDRGCPIEMEVPYGYCEPDVNNWVQLALDTDNELLQWVITYFGGNYDDDILHAALSGDRVDLLPFVTLPRLMRPELVLGIAKFQSKKVLERLRFKYNELDYVLSDELYLKACDYMRIIEEINKANY